MRKRDVIYKTQSAYHVALSRQNMTEPRTQVTFVENLVKFSGVVLEICERKDKQTDRQTDTLITILLTLYGAK